MVVIETKSEIEEMSSHEMVTAQHMTIDHHFRNGNHSSLFFVNIFVN